MIDGYKIQNGKVRVVNYNKNNVVSEEEREYQDNIEELLKAENIEEHLYDLKRKAEEDIKGYEGIINYYKNKRSDSNFTFFMFIFSGVFLGMILNNISLLLIVLGASVILKIKQTISINKEIRNSRRAIAGTQLVLEGIEEQINKNQRDLRRLRNDDRKESDNIRNGYRQFDLSELDMIDDNLELWYHVGENEEKYLKYLEKGILEENLEDTFETEEVRVLKRVLTNRRQKK